MPSKTHNLETCSTWEKSHSLFDRPKPKGSKWHETERPLGSNGQHHYRVERERDGSYSVILYSTTMARFYKPEADGSYRMDLHWDTRATSTGFMHSVVHQSKIEGVKTTCGKEVWRALCPSGSYVYDAQGLLILERSTQQIVKKQVVNPDVSEWVKKAKVNLSPLINLLELRVESLVPEFEGLSMGYRTGRAFQENGRAEDAARTMRSCGFDPSSYPWQPYVEELRELYEASVLGLVQSRKAKAERNSYYPARAQEYTRPTPKACTVAFYGHLKKLCQHSSHDYVKTSMWPETSEFASSAICG